MSRPRRTRNDPSAMMENEKSVWDIYNNLADIRDDDLIKDWNDTLNFLLIFAAIFAAVLIALIVESMKLLQEDPQDATNAILLYMSSQLANNTMTPYQPTVFDVPQYAVVVNALLFASLCCSLVAALAAVLALQWVNEYDARIDTVDSEKRALIRHFRYLGAGKWKLAEIIAVLPLLLHSSVFLFFAGIIAWLRSVHQLISWICVTGAAAAVLFYIVTALLSATLVDSPFRSPMARAFRYVQYTAAWYIVNALYQAIQLSCSYAFYRLSWSYAVYRRRRILQANKNTKHVEEGRAKCSDNKLSALIWTENHVEVANQSTRRLLRILKDVLPFHAEETAEHRVPYSVRTYIRWTYILNKVSQAYLDKVTLENFSAADLEAVSVLVSCWTLDYFQNGMFRLAYGYHVNKVWDDWEPIERLIGPLLHCGTLQVAQLDFIMAVVKAMWLKDSEQGAKQLVELIKTIAAPTTLQEEHLLSYSIDCLSTLLFTRGAGHAYRQVAGYAAEVIAAPVGQVCAGMEGRGTIELSLSAIHSVVFNSSSRHTRKYWASEHRLFLSSDLGEDSDAVRVLHSSITSRIASKGALERDISLARKYVQVLCRLLAYTPFETGGDRNSARAGDIIRKIPNSLHSEDWDPKLTPPALTSLVWLQKLKEIPRVHEYLEVLLLYRQRSPDFSPVWRDWISDTRPAWEHNGASSEDQLWLDQRRKDRQIIEVFGAFDSLVADGCSTAQHLVLVRLLIDDLSEDRVAGDESYYTDARKAVLRGIKDPALRLVGARAGNMAYPELVPPLEAEHWLSEPWKEALVYWCGRYEDVDALIDEALIVAILSQHNGMIHSVLLKSCSQNATLQNRLRQVLESRLNEPSDANATLLIHAVARTASWFPDYLTPVNVTKIVRLLSNTPVSPVVLPLLPFLVPFLHTPDQLEVVMTTRRTTILDGPFHIGQPADDDIYGAFKDILREPPPCMQALQGAHEHIWNAVSGSVKEILDLIRMQEGSARAVLRWNGRARISSGRRDADLTLKMGDYKIPLEIDGSDIQDRALMGIGRPYSCTASWDM